MKIFRSVLSLLTIVSVALCAASCGKGSDACEYAASRNIEGREVYYVDITVKDYGTISLLLDATTAPITVHNFLSLVADGFYDGLTFHRIAPGFVIQGGDPKGDGTGGSSETITGEFALNGYDNDISHIRGVISMARSQKYDSASSQFFIMLEDNTYLDGEYAAFGYVISGMNIIDEICKDAIVEDSLGNVLAENQPVIESIVIRE